MAKRKNDPSGQSGGSKRGPRMNNDRELRAIYDRVRQQFSAADLQKYTEIEDGVPLEQVIAEMEKVHRTIARKRA